MKSQSDAEGLAKICWNEFKGCLKIFSKTSKFRTNAKNSYQNSIMILLGRIRYLEDKLQASYDKISEELSTEAPEEQE